MYLLSLPIGTSCFLKLHLASSTTSATHRVLWDFADSYHAPPSPPRFLRPKQTVSDTPRSKQGYGNRELEQGWVGRRQVPRRLGRKRNESNLPDFRPRSRRAGPTQVCHLTPLPGTASLPPLSGPQRCRP